MSIIVNFLRRIGGAKAAPATGSEGQVAVYKAGTAPTDAASVYFHDGVQWVEILDTAKSVGANVAINGTAPGAPHNGDLWLNTTSGALSTWNGTAWVAASTPAVTVSETAQATPGTAALWFRASTKELSVWDGAQWSHVAFTNITNLFDQPQAIDTSHATWPALRVTQRGAGPALLVEDETNADPSPFVVDSAGSVGIGVLNPANKLEVSGSAQATSFEVGHASDTTITRISPGIIAVEGGTVALENRTNVFSEPQGIDVNHASFAALRITQRGAGHALLVEDEASPDATPFVIDGNGFVGVGCTPTFAFDVKYENMRVGNDVSGSAGLQMGRSVVAANNGHIMANFGEFRYYNGNWGSAGLPVFSISPVGNITSLATYNATGAGSAVQVTSAGALLRSSSSIKYKKDVESIDPAIVDNAVKNLRPVWYRPKKAVGDVLADWSHFGLIAEEVDRVEKRIVNYKTEEVSYDDEGRRIITKIDKPEPEDVDYARLSVLLLDYVQRLTKRIEALEARP